MQNPNTFLAKDGISDADLLPAARDMYEALVLALPILKDLDALAGQTTFEQADNAEAAVTDALAKARGKI
jgi:hypothetical protein